jgi:hypothetical protein
MASIASIDDSPERKLSMSVTQRATLLDVAPLCGGEQVLAHLSAEVSRQLSYKAIKGVHHFTPSTLVTSLITPDAQHVPKRRLGSVADCVQRRRIVAAKGGARERSRLM